MKTQVGPELADAFFLANHPGWSYADLLACPADLRDLITMIDAERGEARERARARR